LQEAFEIALGPLDEILTLIGGWPLAFWSSKDDLLACCVFAGKQARKTLENTEKYHACAIQGQQI
jgi:hypothetical protein